MGFGEVKLIVKGVEGPGEAGSRMTSRDTAGLSWKGTPRRALGSAVEVEERRCLHSPSPPQTPWSEAAS